MTRRVSLARALRDQQARDQYIKTHFPGWGARRAEARMRIERSEYAAACYTAAQRSTQRVARNRRTISELGVLKDADLEAIREWSRDEWRQNAIYSGMIRRSVDHWLGTGHDVIPKTGDAPLDDELRAAFKEYGRKDGGFDAERRFSFKRRQRLVALSMLRDGDHLVYKSDEGWQFFEGGQIGTPRGYDNSKMRILSGIQIDGANRPVRYWVADYSDRGYIDGTKARGLRADRCLFIENTEFTSGLRAVPILANALPRFQDLDGMLEAELLGSRAASSIMGEIHSEDPNAFNALSGTNKSDDAKDSDSPRRLEWSPGTIVNTRGDEKFTIHSPNRPSQMFADFCRMMFRICGMPLAMPLELSLFDITDANFTVGRMLVQMAQRSWDVFNLQHDEQFVIPVYLDWLANQKDVTVPAATPKPRNFELHAPQPPWIDPKKEAEAKQVLLECGAETLTNVAKTMQRDVEDILEEQMILIVTAKQIAAKYKHDDWRDVLRNVGRWHMDPAWQEAQSRAKATKKIGDEDEDDDED